MNFQKLMYECIDNITNLEFYDENRSLPEDPNGCSIICTVCDFVLTKEACDEFVNEGDELIDTIYSVMLPMKFDVIKDV